MKEPLKTVAELVAQANDQFNSQYQVDTLLGILDKTLRQQGMASDAVTIDCFAQNKKLFY